uniref:Uncharacterized protein n=1 Tax=Amphimedon queenslandica TaxID=400682 RepID=A0A1X7UVM5_AMPQE
MTESVEYLGHLITAEGLMPTPKQVEAVLKFSRLSSDPAVRQFVGLTSYKRRFIDQFAKVAAPLHALTWKNIPFSWSED